MSPSKSATSVKREDGEDDEEIDTRSLLERMKETVEGMKQRRSLAQAVPLHAPMHQRVLFEERGLVSDRGSALLARVRLRR